MQFAKAKKMLMYTCTVPNFKLFSWKKHDRTQLQRVVDLGVVPTAMKGIVI